MRTLTLSVTAHKLQQSLPLCGSESQGVQTSLSWALWTGLNVHRLQRKHTKPFCSEFQQHVHFHYQLKVRDEPSSVSPHDRSSSPWTKHRKKHLRLSSEIIMRRVDSVKSCDCRLLLHCRILQKQVKWSESVCAAIGKLTNQQQENPPLAAYRQSISMQHTHSPHLLTSFLRHTRLLALLVRSELQQQQELNVGGLKPELRVRGSQQVDLLASQKS
ncbi:hypothetical protein Q8A73_018059 [Channa argus]|nr:hypothetical protein Q8A73_018059 [Channa argus]